MYDWTIHDYLISVYEKRRLNNPRFSIRAFAQHLDISDSTLSKILRKKRPIGKSLAAKFEKKLNVKFDVDRAKLDRKTIEYKNLEFEKNEIEYPWYFVALIELAKVQNKIDIKAAAQQLQVPPETITSTLEQLVQVGLLQKIDAEYTSTVEAATGYLNPPLTSQAARKYQLASLVKSTEALANIDFNERIHNATYFHFDSKQMDEVRNCIKTFNREIARITLKHTGTADAVYCVQASAFPILKTEGSHS